MQNTNLSLKNAISVIEDEILIIKFGENESSSIIYYLYSDENEKSSTIYYSDSGENENNYSIRSTNKKTGNLGAGPIIGIILACLVAVAAVIIFIIYFKKRNKREEPVPESTVTNLHI
jgi:hypothetical protein